MSKNNKIVLVIILIITTLVIVSCVPSQEVSEKTFDPTSLTDEEILQQYPDDLDKALEEIDLVFEE